MKSEDSTALSKRALLRALLGLFGGAAAAPVLAQPTGTHLRLSLAEPPAFRMDPPDIIARRFALYQQAGVQTLRCEVSWNEMEVADGQWRLPPDMPYLRQALAAGFSLKLLFSAMGSVPHWFVQAQPDMLIRDQFGDTTQLSLSLWHPALNDVLDAATSAMHARLAGTGLFDPRNYVIVDFGAAGEPKYPTGWNLNKAARAPMFWYFGPHAAADFAAHAHAAYGTLSAANAAWGSAFTAWDEIALPQPGAGGPLWRDVLTWYRDSKRRFESAQIARYTALFQGGPRPVVLIPGEHITALQWLAATGAGPETEQISGMLDNDFIITAAAKAGCMLQFTGAQDETELAWIVRYLAQNGFANTPLWGENAGMVPNAANSPGNLTRLGEKYRLYGVEYINASTLFAPDRITPAPWLADLTTAYQAAR